MLNVSDKEWVIGSAQPAASARRLPFGLGRLADERLAQLVTAGRERAFAVLYERYHQPLYRYCRSMLRNDQDAQDALQSTFESALAALQEGKRNAPFRPWLFRIAHNEAVTVIRRRRDGGQEVSDSMLPPAASASEEADNRARMAVLIDDLGQLPERQRAALVMRELNGLSHADIAVVLATSVTAAKQAIFDARTALTELAEGRALPCEEVRRKISERDGRVLRSRRLRSHLRDCSKCAAFAAAIPERRADLRAIAPLLPAAASAALLARLGKSASIYGSGGSAGGAGTAGTVGKLGGTAFVSKAAAGVTVVVTAAAGLGAAPKVLPLIVDRSAPRVHTLPARASHQSAAAAALNTIGKPAAAGSGSSTPQAARARADAIPGPPEHHAAASVRHARRAHRSAHAATSSGLGGGSASHIASSHGQSGLAHGQSAGAAGHTKTASTSPSTAAHKTKPVHFAPGRTGTAGKPAKSRGHTKNSRSDSDHYALVTPPPPPALVTPPAQSAPATTSGQAAKASSNPGKTQSK